MSNEGTDERAAAYCITNGVVNGVFNSTVTVFTGVVGVAAAGAAGADVGGAIVNSLNGAVFAAFSSVAVAIGGSAVVKSYVGENDAKHLSPDDKKAFKSIGNRLGVVFALSAALVTGGYTCDNAVPCIKSRNKADGVEYVKAVNEHKPEVK